MISVAFLLRIPSDIRGQRTRCRPTEVDVRIYVHCCPTVTPGGNFKDVSMLLMPVEEGGNTS
jgi:hypothetical protein